MIDLEIIDPLRLTALKCVGPHTTYVAPFGMVPYCREVCEQIGRDDIRIIEPDVACHLMELPIAEGGRPIAFDYTVEAHWSRRVLEHVEIPPAVKREPIE